MLQTRLLSSLAFIAYGIASSTPDHVAPPSSDTGETLSFHLPLPMGLKPEDIVLTYLDEISRSGNKNDGHRSLEIGDFARFNELFANAQLKLPDAELSESGLTLSISNLVCTNVNVGDIQANHSIFQENGQDVLAYTVTAYPVAITCSADYSFEVLFIPGSGRFTAVAENSRAETRIDLSSESGGFASGPPTVAAIEYCNADINTNGNIDFEGATVERLLELFKELISNVVDKYAADALCDLLSDSGPELLGNVLNQTNSRLDKWLFPESEELTNPLFVEQSFVIPENITLIDFQANSTSSSVSDLFVRFLKEADGLFGGAVVDPVTGQSELGINSFLREALLDETSGAWTLDLSSFADFNPVLFESHDKLTQTSVVINGADIVGLDTLQTFNPFSEIGAFTVSNSFKWESLFLEISLTVDIKPSTKPDSILLNPDPVNIVEVVTVRIEFTNVDVDLAMFMPIDQTLFESITLGSILSTDNILPCFMSALHSLEVSGLKVSVGDISVPTLDGFISPGIDRLVSHLAEAAFLAYEPTFLRAMPGLFQETIRTMINARFLDSLVDVVDGNGCSAVAGAVTDEDFLDFRDLLLPADAALALGGSGQSQYGNLFRSAFSLVKDQMLATDPNTGLAKINSGLITDFTQSQSGTPGRLFFDGDLLKSEKRVRAGGLDAMFRLRLYDAYINNLDTIGTPLSVLEPVSQQPYQLNNSAGIGLSRPLELGIRFFLGLSNDESNIENELEIRLDMEALQILLTGFATVSKQALMGFPISDITNLQCWLATIPAPTLDSQGLRVDKDDLSLSVSNFLATVVKVGLNVSCIECSGPGIAEMEELLSEMKDYDSVTDVSSTVFDLIQKLVEGNFLQLSIDRALNDAKKLCPHSSDYDPNFTGTEYEALDVAKSENSTSFFLGLVVVVVSLGIIVLGIVLTTKFIVRRRHQKWIKSLSPRQLDILFREQRKNDDDEAAINESTKSMFRSEVIPFWIQWFMVAVLVGNIAFFLSGHLSLAASVTIMASLGGQTFSEEGFFEFSIAKSTMEIWNAGGQELAILIFLFSFVWPYTKTVMTMALWFAPPSTVSVARRGSILLWLDFLAKWSTIDIFVLIVTIVSFRVSVQSPDVAFLPEDFYSINLLVAPKWGLYANLTAQIISQLSSHFIIHYHRRIVEVASKGHTNLPDLAHANTVPLDDDESDIEQLEKPPSSFVVSRPLALTMYKDRLYQQTFRRPHRGDTDKLVPRRIVSPLLVFFAVCCCVLVVFGCALPSYSVSALGIVGLLVESGQKFTASETSYSVITTIKLLFDQASLTGTAADYIGLGTLSFILLVSVLFAPVAQSLVLLIQWFAPLSRKRRHRLMISLEILQAWQYAEVYLLAIIVGSWQLGPISEFMINPYCEALKGFFAEMVYYGLLKEEDAQCFRTDVKIEPTFYLLFTSAICLALINSFVMNAVSQYFRDIHLNCIQDIVDEKFSNFEDPDIREENWDDSMATSQIHPVPVLFTDRYRWFLHREDEMLLSRESESPAYSSGSLAPESSHDTGAGLEAETPNSWDTEVVRRVESDVFDVSIDETSLYTNTA